VPVAAFVERIPGDCEERRVKLALPGISGLAGLAQQQLEAVTDPVAKLGCGLFGEGDRGDLAHRDTTGHEGQHPIDKRGRLSRACAGLNEQRLLELVTNTVPRQLIWELGGGHDATSSES